MLVLVIGYLTYNYFTYSLDIKQLFMASSNIMADIFMSETNNQQEIDPLLQWHSRNSTNNYLSFIKICYYIQILLLVRVELSSENYHLYIANSLYLKFVKKIKVLLLFYSLIENPFAILLLEYYKFIFWVLLLY